MKLGEQLKEARTRAGYKQEELAQTLGVSRQTISNWENNRSLMQMVNRNTNLEEKCHSSSWQWNMALLHRIRQTRHITERWKRCAKLSANNA